MIRTYKPSQIADGILAEELFRDTEFVLASEIERLTRERDEAREEVARLREVIRTIRARCVELDDSDAVSATFDITSAALEDEP